MLGVQRPRPVRPDQIVGDHRADIRVTQQLKRVEFVRGTEPVEEMHERNTGFERRGLRDQRRVVRFLHVGRGHQREPGRAGHHHIGMIAEDR